MAPGCPDPDQHEAFRKRLWQTPKAELHVHFEGTVDSALLQQLAKQNGVALDAATTLPRAGGDEPFVVSPPVFQNGNLAVPHCFEEFIRRYVKTTEAIQRPEDILEVGRHYVETARHEHIVASELHFTASTFAQLGRPMDELFDALRLVEQIGSAEGHQLRWIFDVVRNVSRDGFETLALIEQAKARGVTVVAIGLGGYEKLRGPEPFQAVFKAARERGFKSVAHAGETAGSDSVRETIQRLRPSRIGHGIRAWDDPAVVALLKEQRIAIEVCPWSNLLLEVCDRRSLPMAQIAASDISFVIGSDDPGIFGKTLTDNFVLARELGASEEQLLNACTRSLELARS